MEGEEEEPKTTDEAAPEEPEPEPDPSEEDPKNPPSATKMSPVNALSEAPSKESSRRRKSSNKTLLEKSLSSTVRTSESKIPASENIVPVYSTTGSTKSALKQTDDSGNNQAVERVVGGKVTIREGPGIIGGGGANAGSSGFPGLGNFPCAGLLHKRSPFIHNPPQPEERRARIQNPRSPKEYIINLREDLADFQESHGLPRTRDYTFLSLGLALAQETARAICSLFLMFAEIFPILGIVSLILRFALDKLIEILETTEPAQKLRKSIIFGLQMLVIVIPLWILIGTIIIPLISLAFSIVKRMLLLKGGKRKTPVKTKCKASFNFFY